MSTKKYRTFPHFIAYFDILGYENIVHNRPDFNLASIIDKMLASKFWMAKNKLKSPVRPKFYCFSDNFVICFRRKKKMGAVDYSQLGWIIVIMQQLQTLLSIKGVFIRGGITEGNLFTGKNFIYGPGIIEAYKIEDKIAIYPRIVVSKELVNIVIKNTISMANEVSLELSALGYDINDITENNVIELHQIIWTIVHYIEQHGSLEPEKNMQIFWGSVMAYKNIYSRCILQDDKDTQYYVNYMQHIVNAPHLEIQTFDEYLDKLILRLFENIEIEIVANRKKVRILEKYIWLLEYLHSWFRSSNIENSTMYIELTRNYLEKLSMDE